MTNPALYSAINARGSVPDLYSDGLIAEGVMTAEGRAALVAEYNETLAASFRAADSFSPARANLAGQWAGMREPRPEVTEWDTGLGPELLRFVGARSVRSPEGFNLHTHLAKAHVEARLRKLEAVSYEIIQYLVPCTGRSVSPCFRLNKSGYRALQVAFV
jgi:2-oxoglutarate dehydrogenase complex dehydrogenase (E1) component-like enzyme